MPILNERLKEKATGKKKKEGRRNNHFPSYLCEFELIFILHTGRGIPIRHVLGKSKMILGLLEGIPTMLKGEVSMVCSISFLDSVLCTTVMLLYFCANV